MNFTIRRATYNDKPEWLRMRHGLWPDAPLEYLALDLDELLAQAHRSAAGRHVLSAEPDMLGQPVAQRGVAVVRVAVGGGQGSFDGFGHAGQRGEHRLVAGEFDRSGDRLTFDVGWQRGDLRAQSGGHGPQHMWVVGGLVARTYPAV